MPKDVLDEIMAQIRAAAPELPSARVEAIAMKIRQDFGGAKTYIKKAPAEGKARRLGDAIAAGASLVQAFDEIHVSRATGYRYLSRKWPVR